MKKESRKDGAPIRKAATKKVAPRKAPTASRGAKNLLSAGIKALGNAQNEAIARQSRMFESILGLGRTDAPETPVEKPANPLAAALDPFGFRKFEDVFDQRVARSLLNLGVPTAEAFAGLTAEVERLRATVSALEAQVRKR